MELDSLLLAMEDFFSNILVGNYMNWFIGFLVFNILLVIIKNMIISIKERRKYDI